MKEKSWKKNLRAAVVAIVLVLLIGGVVTASKTQDNSEKIKVLFKPIDTEVHKNLAEKKDRSSQDLNTFAEYLVKKQGKNLELIIDELENITGKKLDRDKRKGFKYLIVREHLSKISQDYDLDTQNTSKLIIEPTIVQVDKNADHTSTLSYLSLSNTVTYPIYWWVQVSPEVNGGSGTDSAGKKYSVNGGNGLYKVSIQYTTNYAKYTLYFYDEDHPDPATDAIYDAWRKLWYGRIEDIESFTVQNGIIYFDDIWDNDKTYAEWWGQHGDKTRNYVTKVYVSNVWNHAMDTLDKNPSMSKIWRYTGWS
ncbi:MAG: hypothetical protein WA130_11755 [Candidatus Methanoperedens sp.]